jgi:hypothetical protein
MTRPNNSFKPKPLRLGLIQALGAMGKYLATLVALLATGPAMADRCVMPTARQDFFASSTVVAAEARRISVTPAPDDPGKYFQTILWRVHESWKGPHPYGRDFTTRTTIKCPTCSMYKLKAGQFMLLYLNGKEPYELPWCSHSNRLEHSLKDIPLLYQLSGARHGT